MTANAGVRSATGDLRPLGIPLGRWSPDGTRLLVTNDDDALVSVDVTTRTQQTIDVGRNGFSHSWPVWSPDGARVGFVGCKEDDCDVYVVDVDGRNRKQVTKTPGVEGSLDWGR